MSPACAPVPGELEAQGGELAPSPVLCPEQLPELSSGEVPGKAQERFAELVNFARRHKGEAHISVLDLESGQALYAEGEHVPENPASNMKVLTAAAALELLGPGFHFKTELYAEGLEGKRAKSLSLKGGGDPSFSSADLLRLAQAIELRGVQEVGDLIIDQSHYDGPYVPPAFEQQPDEWAAFRAPVSAMALDHNTVSLNVLPASSVGAQAEVWFEPLGASESSGSIVTSAGKNSDQVSWTLSSDSHGELTSALGGSLSADAGRRRYTRRQDDPRLVPGRALRAILKSHGLRVTGQLLLGAAKGERLTQLPSAPLSQLLFELGKDSNNFTAEMVMLSLCQAGQKGQGQAESRAWSYPCALQALKNWLTVSDLPVGEATLKNGSGLFDANRVTTNLLSRVLLHMWRSPYAPEFLSQLATAGVDGTLIHRFRKTPLAGRLRAKTGTLGDIDSLSGYILRAEGRAPLVFSVIVSGHPAPHGEVRQKIDAALLSLAPLLKRTGATKSAP